MNKPLFIESAASILFDCGVRLKAKDDCGALLEATGITRALVVNKYREMAGDDVEVSINLSNLEEQGESMTALVYKSIYEDIDVYYGDSIDEALWLIQRNKGDDYSQDQEDRVHRIFGNE